MWGGKDYSNSYQILNTFHATSLLFLHPQKKKKLQFFLNFLFSDVSRGYRKTLVA